MMKKVFTLLCILGTHYLNASEDDTFSTSSPKIKASPWLGIQGKPLTPNIFTSLKHPQENNQVQLFNPKPYLQDIGYICGTNPLYLPVSYVFPKGMNAHSDKPNPTSTNLPKYIKDRAEPIGVRCPYKF